MNGQNDAPQPVADASAPDVASEAALSPAPPVDPVQESLGQPSGEGSESASGQANPETESAQETGGQENTEAEGSSSSGGQADRGAPQEDGGVEAVAKTPIPPTLVPVVTGGALVSSDPASEPAPVPFDSATQSPGQATPPAPAQRVGNTPPTVPSSPPETSPPDAVPTPDAPQGSSPLVAQAQAALDREGLGASVTVTQLDANESAALRVLLLSKNRDAVLRAASVLIASSAGGHSWVFIGGAPPDPSSDLEQKSGAVLHVAD